MASIACADLGGHWRTRARHVGGMARPWRHHVECRPPGEHLYLSFLRWGGAIAASGRTRGRSLRHGRLAHAKHRQPRAASPV